MIEGKLISKIDSNLNSYLLCSTFIETDSRSNQSTIAANSLYQFINSEQELGVLIGSNEGRSLVLVFTNLEKSDFYQNIATVYLFSMHIPIEICCQNIAEVMKIHGSNVSSLILIELNQRYFISCLEAGSNIHVLHLKEDQYLIRDLLVVAEGNLTSQEVMGQAIHHLVETPDNDEIIYSEIMELVLKDVHGYPKPVGMNVNIFLQNSKKIMRMIPIEKLRKNQINKPKNPVTAFNFYSSCNRQIVAAEYDNNITNNELNRELGRRWKEMSEKEKLTYNRMAQDDKKRYKKDLERMRREGGSSSRIVSKPLTSYNHFVHQEKQFVCGLSYNNAQTITGRHGGDRWSSMHPDEKKVYEILRDVEVLEYQNQF